MRSAIRRHPPARPVRRRPALEWLEDRRVLSLVTSTGINPAVAIDGKGGYVVVWDDATSSASQAILARQFDATGKPLGAPFSLPITGASVFGTIEAAGNASGDFVVTYGAGSSANQGVDAEVFGPGGVPVAGPVQVIAPGNAGLTVFGQGGPSGAAINTAGTFAAAGDVVTTTFTLTPPFSFTFADDSVVQEYSPSGVAGPAPTPPLPAPPPSSTFGQLDPAVAMDDRGNVVVAWVTPARGVTAELFSANGTLQTTLNVAPPKSVTGDFFRNSVSVAMNAAGQFAIVWPTGTGLAGRTYDTTGDPQQAGALALEVNPPPDNSTSPPTLTAFANPAVGIDSAGDVVLAFRRLTEQFPIPNSSPDVQSDNVFAQGFNFAGSPAGAAFQVNSQPLSPTFPTPTLVAMNGGGSFVVAWSDRLSSPGAPNAVTSVFATPFPFSALSAGPVVPSPPPSPSPAPGSIPDSSFSSSSVSSASFSSGSGLSSANASLLARALRQLEAAAPAAEAQPVGVPSPTGPAGPVPPPAAPPEAPPLAVFTSVALDTQAGGGGVARSGDISGVVFLDRNGNGVREAGEPGLAGLTVFIDMHGDGAFHPGDPYTVTNDKGEYVFLNLPLNRTYQVRPVAQRYLQQTYPQKGAAQVVQLSDDHPAETDVTFGTVPFRPAAPPVRPVGDSGTPQAPPAEKSDGDQSRNDRPPEARDAAFGGGPFWSAASLAVALGFRLDRREGRRSHLR